MLFWIAYVLTGFLICHPLAFNWNKQLRGHCGNATSQEIGPAAVNMILDLSIVMLPLPVLWSLQMPLKRKVMLSDILSLGLWYAKDPVTTVVANLPKYFRFFRTANV